MFESELYLQTIIPQWGIFLSLVLVIIGHVDKKNRLSMAGWIALIIVGLIALIINIFGGLDTTPGPNGQMPKDFQLMVLGWQTGIAGALSAFTLLLRQRKSTRYKLLAILTVLFSISIFFQYYHFIQTFSQTIN